MIGTIYKFTSPSGKSYIGQTIDYKRRRASFLNSKCYYSGSRLNNAIKKYGAENFSYEIVVQIYGDTKEELREKLDELEKYYILKYDTYKNGYNMTEGGSGSRGCFQTEESRQKISLFRKGRLSPNKGKHLSIEQRAILSNYAKSRIGNKNPFYGKTHSEKTKSKIRKANSKPVIQIDPRTGEEITEFLSALEAGKSLGKPRANSEIVKVCRGYISPLGKKYITALGYKWKYKESSTTISKESTLQANGNGNGEPCNNTSEDIVSTL